MPSSTAKEGSNDEINQGHVLNQCGILKTSMHAQVQTSRTLRDIT